MLTLEHFKNAEIKLYYDDAGIYETDSNGIMDLLEQEYIDGINHIGIYRGSRMFSAIPPYQPIIQSLVIDYYHLDSISPNAIQPPKHHLNSYRHNVESGEDWVTTCQHTVRVKYPEIKLVKLIYDFGNTDIKKSMRDYARNADYLNLKQMGPDEAVWYMSIILGSSE